MAMSAKAQCEQLFQLQIQGDKYARLLIGQKQRLKQLDIQHKRLLEEMKELRMRRGEGDHRGGGMNAVRTKIADEKRELTKLENRLSACRSRESKMKTMNNELKRRVDELRAARLLSQTIFEKHQKELKDVQRQMQENFKQATQTMAERDRILAQAYSLTNSNLEEQESFDHVYHNLAAIIKHEQEKSEAYRKQVLEEDPMDCAEDFMRGNMSIDDEQNLKKSLIDIEQTMEADKKAVECVNTKLQEYETVFATLQKELEVEDCHDIIGKYKEKEEENFALFKYVQNLRNEVEQLEEEKTQAEVEAQTLSGAAARTDDDHRNRVVDMLVESRHKLQTENAEYERMRAMALREFYPIARAVDRLYNAIGCGDIMQPAAANNNNEVTQQSRRQSEDQTLMMARINSMNNMIAAHGITEGNVLQFLSMIEERCNEVIEQFSKMLLARNPGQMPKAILGANLLPSDPSRALNAVQSAFPEFAGSTSTADRDSSPARNEESPRIVSPNVKAMQRHDTKAKASKELREDDGESDDGEDRVLSRDELQKKAAKSVASLQLSPKMHIAQRSKTSGSAKKKRT